MNKSDNTTDVPAKSKPKLMRLVLTDHFTRFIFIRYYYMPTEDLS